MMAFGRIARARFESALCLAAVTRHVETLDVDTLDVDTLDVETLDVETLGRRIAGERSEASFPAAPRHGASRAIRSIARPYRS